MKKLLSVCLSLLLLCGCGAEQMSLESEVPQEASLSAIAVPNEVVYDWGIHLSAEDVSPTGLTLICKQSGGTVTGELSTGSYYQLHVLRDGTWKPAPTLPQEYDVVWTAEAWIIPLNGETQWEINWEWLYGELAPGTYRVSKEFVDWRQPGEFDKELLSAEFEIQ